MMMSGHSNPLNTPLRPLDFKPDEASIGKTVKQHEPAMIRRFFRETVGPLLLMLVCPPTAILIWHTVVSLDGSFLRLFSQFRENGLLSTIQQVWGPIFFGSPAAWVMIGLFVLVQYALWRFVPGRTVTGPRTAAGEVPLYKDNGLACFLITICSFCAASFGLKLFPATVIYDHFGELIAASSLASVFLCLGLCLRGKHLPSTADRSRTGNIIFDYYWGVELHPRICGMLVKQFTNCRFGMMSWGLIVISCAAAQQERSGLSNAMFVSVALQLLYVTKFFYWERGYFQTLDMAHDRAGFYICWGCLVWVPALYTSSALYLVHHPHNLPTWFAGSLLVFGSGAIALNYWVDSQRTRFRAKEKNLLIWGKPPAYTEARYECADGIYRVNQLLASGFWGVARHFRFVPELLATLAWSLPALFHNFLPYFYFTFLTGLLWHRLHRDEKRCQQKYGKDWETHCGKVPWKLIPYVY